MGVAVDSVLQQRDVEQQQGRAVAPPQPLPPPPPPPREDQATTTPTALAPPAPARVHAPSVMIVSVGGLFLGCAAMPHFSMAVHGGPIGAARVLMSRGPSRARQVRNLEVLPSAGVPCLATTVDRPGRSATREPAGCCMVSLYMRFLLLTQQGDRPRDSRGLLHPALGLRRIHCDRLLGRRA
jgi:hypothetical protein